MYFQVTMRCSKRRLCISHRENAEKLWIAKGSRGIQKEVGEWLYSFQKNQQLHNYPIQSNPIRVREVAKLVREYRAQTNDDNACLDQLTDDGKVRCPILRAYTCRLCGANCDHTRNYCLLTQLIKDALGASSFMPEAYPYQTPRTSTGLWLSTSDTGTPALRVCVCVWKLTNLPSTWQEKNLMGLPEKEGQDMKQVMKDFYI